MTANPKLADFHRKAAEHFAQLAANSDPNNRGTYVAAALHSAVDYIRAAVGMATGGSPLGEEVVKLERFLSSLMDPPAAAAGDRLLESFREYLSLPSAGGGQSYEDAALELLTVEMADWALETAQGYVRDRT